MALYVFIDHGCMFIRSDTDKFIHTYYNRDHHGGVCDLCKDSECPVKTKIETLLKGDNHEKSVEVGKKE
jgi:hypothetical protein